MPDVLVVVELELVLLDCSAVHHAEQHPRTHIETGHFYENFALGFADFGQAWPVHLIIASFDDAVRNPKEVLVRISAKDVFGLHFPSLEDGLLRLLVELLHHDL